MDNEPCATIDQTSRRRAADPQGGGLRPLNAEGIYFYNAWTNAIEFFSFATHRITQITIVEKPIGNGGLAVSPDGRWILFAQLDQSTSKIMLVENFRW